MILIDPKNKQNGWNITFKNTAALILGLFQNNYSNFGRIVRELYLEKPKDGLFINYSFTYAYSGKFVAFLRI